MRIALVQDYLRLGGTESQAVALANNLATKGHAVLLLTFRPGGALAPRVDDSVRLVSLQRRDRRLDWFAPGLISTLRVFRPDVVQTMGRMANCHGWRVIRSIPQTRVAATFRTGKAIPRFYVRTMRLAPATIANSDEARQRVLRDHRLDPDRVHVIRNALLTSPEEAGPGAREDVRAGLGTAAETTVFLCVAMMRPGKGHRDLIEVFARLNTEARCELWLAGEGIERSACEERVRTLGMEKRIRFLGQRSDTNRLYAGADVAVLTSQAESLPNFLVEAQWNGLPVVAWDFAGVAETFTPGKSGLLVPVGDTSGTVASLESLLRDPATRNHMGDHARTFARREFDPERQQARYLELYAAITKSTPST